MRKIISSIDIGSDYIKLVIGEFIGNSLHILSASKVNNNGITDGRITDKEMVKTSINKAVSESSNTLGIKIKKVILGTNLYNPQLIKTTATIEITNESKTVTGEDIASVISECSKGTVTENHVLIGVLPVEFKLDEDRIVKDPKGMKADRLSIRAVAIIEPKDYIIPKINILEECGLKVVDIIPNSVGDYYAFKTESTNNSTGIIINMGYENTSISVFNKGILTASKNYELGAKNIVSDIGYIKKLDDNISKALFKDLVLASSKLSSRNEYRIIKDLDGDEIKINEYELAQIAESRIQEILNLAKKQINILTKKEISYIIITGGLTELKDFNLVVEESFGKNVYIGKIDMIGVRDNSFASSVGIIKYFDNKVSLRGKTFTIFHEEEFNQNNIEENTTSSNSLLDRVFGYFFDN